MFGAKGDGVYDDAIAFQAAVNYAESINSSVSTRAPRVGIHFGAKKYYLKQTVKVTKGTVYWQGAGMYQTVFTPHPEANASDLQYKYFFDFSNPSWVSNSTRTLNEVHLRNFTFLGDGVTLRPVFYLGGVGWDCVFDTVHVYSAALSAFVCDDLFDAQFYNLRINSCGYLHDPANSADIFTHPIMLRGKYDNCNAIRFIAPHFEMNFTGVVSITGRSNNISFTAMPKFENNSRGAASGAKYPVISINGTLAESIKIDNPFISHPASITEWFIESNSRHLSLRGGSYMSPSDTSGQTAKKWIRIHRGNWTSTTRCVGAVIDIDMMHVNGLGDTGIAPISIENDAVVNIKAPRVTDPNRFIDVTYDCQITIEDLTVLGTITAANQTALFNVTGADIKADINVKQQQGTATGLIYVNSDMTAASRRKSKIILKWMNIQTAVGALVSGNDPIGTDEGYVFQASGLVSSIGYCHTGKRMVVRCPDTANCLVAGGNIFLPGGAVTAACTITLMATNFAFRQGWTEISRVNGV
nr:MAG: Pectate lyase superfamily protein [Bacteriophage sp.]